MADECVLRYVAASVGGLDSTLRRWMDWTVSARRFDVHSFCIFKDLETDYPVCAFS